MTVDTDRKYFAVKRNGSGNSGQAMLELLVLLFGLMLLIVGLVVLSAVEGAENAHLLRNKYTAEMAARSSGSEVIDSGEIHAWRRHSLELYRNSADIVIPFTRLYLGVHTPADVLVGSAIPLFFIVVLRPVIYHHDGKHIPKLMAVMVPGW